MLGEDIPEFGVLLTADVARVVASRLEDAPRGKVHGGWHAPPNRRQEAEILALSKLGNALHQCQRVGVQRV